MRGRSTGNVCDPGTYEFLTQVTYAGPPKPGLRSLVRVEVLPRVEHAENRF